MERMTIKASRRVYTVFTIMFGGIPIFLILLGIFLKGSLNIKHDFTFLSLFLVMLILTYTMLAIYKISYDNNQIKYRGLFGTKTINIMDIKRYKIKTETHSNPTKPMFGLFIDTTKKKSEIIIPARLFTSESLNDLMKHIDTITGSAKGKANAGKSVFTYAKKEANLN